ncbi:MAG: thiamine phosphate synthase [Thermodesulfovibrionales bacterium]|jgi:thiamine-phosphate pyrophosphorylase
MRGDLDLKLYLVTDRKLFANISSLYNAVEEALGSGVKAVQLREKDMAIRKLLSMAYYMRKLTAHYCAKLFINDRVDVAIAVDADGVHLTRNSIPASAAKKASKGRLVVGVSTHTLGEAADAVKEEADFITFGPVYQTPSKLKYGEPVGINALKEVCSEVSLPVFAIGGIREDRVREVMDCGCEGVAVISAILKSNDIKKTTERFLRYLQ